MQYLRQSEELRFYLRSLIKEWDFLDGVFKETGYKYIEGYILLELQNNNCLNLLGLAANLNIEKSTASRTVKGMIERGLIKWDKLSSDKRHKHFSLTQAGQKAVEETNKLANNRVANALNTLTEDEIETVIKSFKLYSNAMTKSRKMMGYKFRKIKKSDNKIVAIIIRKVMEEYNAIGPGYSSVDKEVDKMFESYNNSQSYFFVITINEEIKGFGGIGRLEGGTKDTCELKKMYFLNEVRGLGLGKKLVEMCLTKARELGYKKCYLETLKRMHSANNLYAKLGFEKLEKPLGLTGHTNTELWYMKNL